jgi:predicted transcriptional regulator
MGITAEIVASYLRHNQVAASDLPTLIASVHQSFASLGALAPPEPRVPAVPVRRSVQPDQVVCLECGFRAKMLRRHLTRQHNLTPAEYRARWELPRDHPLTAPAYSERRSTMAKEFGLGRKAAEIPPTPGAPPPSKRRRRPRAASTP